MAEHLEFCDEFGRSALTDQLLSLMKDKSVSKELIPFVTKVLRKCVPDEDDCIRQVLENVVNEIRDPIEEEDSEEVIYRRRVLAEKLQAEYDMRGRKFCHIL